MSFSENLRNLRKEHKLTQETLAEKLDVSRQAVPNGNLTPVIQR